MGKPAKSRSLPTDDSVKSAVDELLGEFAATTDGAVTAFDEVPVAPRKGDERPLTAPSADTDALWGGARKKP